MTCDDDNSRDDLDGIDPEDEPMPEPTQAELDLEEIREVAREAAKAEATYLRQAEVAKVAKKGWEALLAKLQRLSLGAAEDYPLFDQPALADPVVSDPAPESEPWRDVPIADLGRFGLSPTIVAKLVDAGLGTIGSMADYTASEKRLTDLPGIGPGKAEKIEEAMLGFWASQPTSTPTAPDVPDVELAAETEAAAETPIACEYCHGAPTPGSVMCPACSTAAPAVEMEIPPKRRRKAVAS